MADLDFPDIILVYLPHEISKLPVCVQNSPFICPWKFHFTSSWQILWQSQLLFISGHWHFV